EAITTGVAPLHLVPVEVAVDHLVEIRSVVRTEWGPVLTVAHVADLEALQPAAADGPRVVRDRIRNRLVLLVAQATAQLTIPESVRVVAVVAAWIARHVRVIRVDQKGLD